MGIGTMTRGEKAVIYVTSQYLTQSPLIPTIDGFEEVNFEVELVHFIQVWSSSSLQIILVCSSFCMPTLCCKQDEFLSSWAYDESLICNHIIVWLLGDDSFCSGALNVLTGINFTLFFMHKLFIMLSWYFKVKIIN